MASGVVVVAGEALVDLVPCQDGSLAPLLGGGPFNTARVLGRLGQSVAFVGRVSRDRLGDRLAAALTADGVTLDEGLRTDLPTSLAMAALDDAGRATYQFYFTGTSAEALDCDTALRALPRDTAALHVGGLGLVLEPLAEAVETLVRQASGHALVMVDPNVRPSLISDFAGYAARLKRIVSQADVVKVSDEDLQVLAPGVPPHDAAQALLGEGPELVLLTLGSEGAVAFGSFGSRATAAPKVKVIDTIGAGDTFSGAWLAAWLRLARPVTDVEAVSESTDFACRAAAWSCTHPGASPPFVGDISGLPNPLSSLR